MILIGTNVISAPLPKVPEVRVVEWLGAQPLEILYLSAVTVAELRFGVASLPIGKRRDGLYESLERQVLPLFAGRVLAFDMAATQAYADLMAWARAVGMAVGTADGYIAAVATANGMSVATRDTGPFEATGLSVINPWTPPQIKGRAEAQPGNNVGLVLDASGRVIGVVAGVLRLADASKAGAQLPLDQSFAVRGEQVLQFLHKTGVRYGTRPKRVLGTEKIAARAKSFSVVVLCFL
jgi:predicted nucleic acid-binding protein